MGTPWGPIWVRISIVHQYGTVERSVKARRVPSGHIGFRQVSIGTLIWPDRTRRGSTGRSTVQYRCRIHVWTHMGPYGVPTGPSGPRRDPTDPQRSAGSTVGPRFIASSPVWAARSSYWRSRCYL